MQTTLDIQLVENTRLLEKITKQNEIIKNYTAQNETLESDYQKLLIKHQALQDGTQEMYQQTHSLLVHNDIGKLNWDFLRETKKHPIWQLIECQVTGTPAGDDNCEEKKQEMETEDYDNWETEKDVKKWERMLRTKSLQWLIDYHDSCDFY